MLEVPRSFRHHTIAPIAAGKGAPLANQLNAPVDCSRTSPLLISNGTHDNSVVDRWRHAERKPRCVVHPRENSN